MGTQGVYYPERTGLWSFTILILFTFMLASCGGGGSGGSGLTNGAGSNTGTSNITGPGNPTGAGDTTGNVTPPQGSINNNTPSVTLGAHQGQALLGPIVNATVSVYKANDFNGVPICTVMTSSLTDTRGPGIVDLSACSILPSVIYFLVVRGGMDIDANDDGILDSAPTPKNGALRALLTGADIIRGGFRINIVTEIAYQSVSDILLTGGAGVDILNRLDFVAQQLLKEDLNGDQVINNADLLVFSPVNDSDSIPIEIAELVEDILAAILSGDRNNLIRLSRQLLLASLGEFDYLSLIIPNKEYQNFIVSDFLVEDGYLYAAGFEADSVDNDIKFLIIDVRDLSNVRAVGEVTLNNLSADPHQWGIQMVKSGSYLYLVSQKLGMIVVNVSDRSSPAARLHIAGNDFNSIAKGGSNNLYVSSLDVSIDPSRKSISIYDINNPGFPSLLNTLHDVSAFSMVYENGYLYAYGSGLSVYNASNRNNLVLLDNLSFPSGSGDKLVYNDGFVYLPIHSAELQGMSIFDVSDPTDIKRKDSVSGLGFVSNLASEGDRLFVGSQLDFNSSLLTTFDITNPGELSILDSRSAPLNFYIDIEDDRIYLSGSRDFTAYDIGALHNRPNYFDFIATSELASQVEVAGNVAFVGDGRKKLLAIDVSTPGQGMEIIDEYDVTAPILDIQIVGNLAYLANADDGLKIIRIGNPAHMSLEREMFSHLNLRNAGSVTVLNNHAYIASEYFLGMLHKVFNNSNSGHFQILAETNNVPVIIKDLAGKGNYIYAIGLDTLHVYSADTLSFISQQNLVANTIEVVGDYAYTTSSNSGLSILNVTNPANPVLFGGVLGLGVGNAVSVSGDIAYVANEFGYIEAYDVSNKISPVLIGISQISGTVLDVFATEDYVYAVNGFGLAIVPAIKRRNIVE